MGIFLPPGICVIVNTTNAQLPTTYCPLQTRSTPHWPSTTKPAVMLARLRHHSPIPPCSWRKPGCPGIFPVFLNSASGNEGPKRRSRPSVSLRYVPRASLDVPKVGWTRIVSSKMLKAWSSAHASMLSQFLHSCWMSKFGFGARSFETQSKVRRETSALHTIHHLR